MIIAEFCKGRNVEQQAVRKYIKRHPEEFEGHTGLKGREITLDPVAIGILEKKYPLAEPIQVIKGVDPLEHAATLKELNDVRKKLDVLKDDKIKLEIKLSNKDAEMFLLEEKQQIELKSQEEVLRKEFEFELEKALDSLKNDLEQKHQDALQEEKNRKITMKEAWRRIRGK